MTYEPNPKLSISGQCRLLRLARSTRYYRTGEESEENLTIMRRIEELYLENPTWGSRKMRDALRLEKIMVNRKRVQRLMRSIGIEAIHPKKNLSKRYQIHIVYPYLLRGVAITKPDQVWSTDITYIRLEHVWV
jgi:putative transposase